jgi:hypothetical protein
VKRLKEADYKTKRKDKKSFSRWAPNMTINTKKKRAWTDGSASGLIPLFNIKGGLFVVSE